MKEPVQGALLGVAAVMLALHAVRVFIPSIGWELLAGVVVMVLFSLTMFYLRDRPPPRKGARLLCCSGTHKRAGSCGRRRSTEVRENYVTEARRSEEPEFDGRVAE